MLDAWRLATPGSCTDKAGRSDFPLHPPMISRVSSLMGAGHTPQQKFAETFSRQVKAIEAGSFRCRIPRMQGLYERYPRMHYHFQPELFVQLGGVTEFSFPAEQFTLRAGEICVLPKGMPHGEFVRGEPEPFENVVVSFYNETIDVHVAHEVERGCPAADEVHFFVTDLYPDLIAYLDRVCELQHRGAAENTDAIRGLLLAEFSLLRTIVLTPTAHPPPAMDTISLCRWLIQHNLQDEGLGLETLAVELNCSPNYLSKLFHEKVGERLVEYINRMRVQNAVKALSGSRLSVKSVAAACGFSEASYFARVFRQATGRSPQQFRNDIRRIQQIGARPPVGRAQAHAVDDTVTIDGELAVRDAELPRQP